MEDELYQLLGALSECDSGVEGYTSTLLRLQDNQSTQEQPPKATACFICPMQWAAHIALGFH